MVWDKDYGESDFYFYSLLCVCHRCMLAQTSRDSKKKWKPTVMCYGGKHSMEMGLTWKRGLRRLDRVARRLVLAKLVYRSVDSGPARYE